MNINTKLSEQRLPQKCSFEEEIEPRRSQQHVKQKRDQ